MASVVRDEQQACLRSIRAHELSDGARNSV